MTSAPPARLAWAEARIAEREPVTGNVTRFRFAVAWERPHRAGQSVELKLTAPDGYAARRFYSIASPPSERGGIDLLIERAADGEVSRFFHDVAEAGDVVEMRGPAGLPFSWAPEDGGPVLLVGGGSGVVPLLAMLRERAAAAPEVPMALLYAARTRAEALYLDELEGEGPERAGLRPRAGAEPRGRGAPDRPGDDGRRAGAVAGTAEPRLRLRLGQFRRGRHDASGRGRGCAGNDQDGAFRVIAKSVAA